MVASRLTPAGKAGIRTKDDDGGIGRGVVYERYRYFLGTMQSGIKLSVYTYIHYNVSSLGAFF